MSSQIAIDGPVASGKSTVGRLTSQSLGWRFLDTGLMYRAATWLTLSEKLPLQDTESITNLINQSHLELEMTDKTHRLLVNGTDVTSDLRSPLIDNSVSAVSRIVGVRIALVKKQKDIASTGPIVMVGRDIGTVVLPNAILKIFLYASVKVRAERRYKEKIERGESCVLSEIQETLLERDKSDSERDDSPMIAAIDSIKIDSTNLPLHNVVERVVHLFKSKS